MKGEKQTIELRAQISKKANENINIVQAKELIKGNKMSKPETIDFILKNFESK